MERSNLMSGYEELIGHTDLNNNYLVDTSST